MRSRRMPCVPLTSLGAKKVAIAEWNTEILQLERSTASGLILNC